jgi:hypothetical protein
LILAKAALALDRFTYGPGLFDIRQLGVVHALLFIAAFAGFAICTESTLVIAFALFVFTDVAYIAMFNSFYMDAASILFLFTTTVCFLWTYSTRSPYWLMGYVLSATLLIGSKAQHSWLALPACIPLGLLFRGSRVLTLVCASVLLVAGGYMVNSTSSDYKGEALWNTIFVKLVPMSPSPQLDLAEIGLGPRFFGFAGRSAYELGTFEEQLFWRREAAKETGFRRVVFYYVKRPRLALLRLNLAFRESWNMRPLFLGNFERATGLPLFAKSKSYALWSRWKRWLGERYPAAGLGAIAFAGILITVAARYSSHGFAFAWLILAAALGEALIGAFADGLDWGRHLLLAQSLLDIYCCFFVAACVAFASRLGTILRDHWRALRRSHVVTAAGHEAPSLD